MNRPYAPYNGLLVITPQLPTLEILIVLTCSEAVVVSMVVTTALVVKSFRAIVKNTEATDREAITMLNHEARLYHFLTRYT